MIKMEYRHGLPLLTKALMVILMMICLDMIIEGITGRCCIWWNVTKTRDVTFPAEYEVNK